MSVETFASSKDTEGNKYWTSFDPYPFKVGAKKFAYMGILNGDGPLAGEKCVVKTSRDGAIKQSDWLLESKRSKIARSLAHFYNKTIPAKERRITFNCPILADIDTMSDCLCINDILGKPKKKWNENESVSIELYLKGKFEDFEYGWVSEADLLVPEAFSHFSWCRSEGSMLVSNLQGVKTSRAFHFTGPVIYSEINEFGSSDCGHEGIKSFFKFHKCNRICKDWPRLGDGVNLQGWGEFMHIRAGSGHRVPSAPVLPPYECESPPTYTEEAYPPARHSSPLPTPLVGQVSPWNPREEFSRQSRDDSSTQRNFTSTSSTLHRHGNSFVFDLTQEFVNQNARYGGRFACDNPASQEAFETELLWFVKKMSYAFYATPPPPYCTCANRETRQCLRSHHEENGTMRDQFYSDESDTSDTKRLLPPEYSDEIVNPRCEFVTYL